MTQGISPPPSLLLWVHLAALMKAAGRWQYPEACAWHQGGEGPEVAFWLLLAVSPGSGGPSVSSGPRWSRSAVSRLCEFPSAPL